MSERTEQIDFILSAAVELAAADDRADYIRKACGGDDELQRQVEELVDAYLSAGDFLESPAPGLPPTVDLGIEESAGISVGRYKLLQQIGEGGFAVVFMAEQEQPVRRRVAVKIIKPGMDSRQVIARFEAERQALAMMDHSNIAKVLDAGTTESGRPFFVMELVKGTPIIEYCDEHRLSIDQRLALFFQVCDAVQHAHQKGVIHRDIKPSNVLVRTEDDKPLVKVIDFGIAKATEARLTDMTLFTEFRQLIGTPAYMSPEQADGSLDIDTRSDVYSLGVLLYELLSGSPPFDPRELKSRAIAEMQRIIREVEPPAPSVRLSTLDADTRILKAKARGFEPDRLAQRLRGELDWIALRALEKDRNRRYSSAAALADDLARYLTNQPVEARPATRGYRFRKYARRNKGLLAAVGAIGIILVGATVVSTRQAVRASRAQRESEAISNFLVESFRRSSPNIDGREVKIVDVLQRTVEDLNGKYLDDPVVRAKLLHTLARTYSSLGLSEQALPLFKEAWELRITSLGEEHPETLSSMASLATNYGLTQRFDEAVPTAERYVQLCRSVYGGTSINYADALQRLSSIYRRCRRAGESVPLANQAVEIYRATYGPEHVETLGMMHEQVAATAQANSDGHSFPFPLGFDDLYHLAAQKLGKSHTLTLSIADNIGYSAKNNGYHEYASIILTDTLRQRMDKLGPESFNSRRSVSLLAELALLHTDPRKGMRDVEVLEEYVPDDPQVVAARKEIERRLALSVDEIADDYVTKIKEAEDGLHAMAPRKSVCRQLAEPPDAFDVVAGRLPEETALWIGRGQYQLWRGRLAEAEADYAKVIEQRPLADEHYEYACLLLARGDDAAYQAFCQRQFERAGEPSEPYQAYLAARLYGVGPAKCVPIELLVSWAEMAAREGHFWQRQALALVYLRAGHLESAAAVFEDLLGGRRRLENLLRGHKYLPSPETTQIWYGLAMAYHAQGKMKEARGCLNHGRKALAVAPTPPGAPLHVHVPSICAINSCYAREAEALFRGSDDRPAGTSPTVPE